MNQKLKELMEKKCEECFYSTRAEEGLKEDCGYLLPLLRQALIHVEATAESSHLTDGFNRRPENKHDILVKKIKEVLEQ